MGDGAPGFCAMERTGVRWVNITKVKLFSGRSWWLLSELLTSFFLKVICTSWTGLAIDERNILLDRMYFTIVFFCFQKKMLNIIFILLYLYVKYFPFFFLKSTSFYFFMYLLFLLKDNITKKCPSWMLLGGWGKCLGILFII